MPFMTAKLVLGPFWPILSQPQTILESLWGHLAVFGPVVLTTSTGENGSCTVPIIAAGLVLVRFLEIDYTVAV